MVVALFLDQKSCECSFKYYFQKNVLPCCQNLSQCCQGLQHLRCQVNICNWMTFSELADAISGGGKLLMVVVKFLIMPVIFVFLFVFVFVFLLVFVFVLAVLALY